MLGEDQVFKLADNLGLSNLVLRIYDDVTDRSVSKIEFDSESTLTADAPTVLFSLLPKYSNFIRRVCVLGHFVNRHGFHPLVIYNEDELRSVLMGTEDEPMSTTGKIANDYRAKRITEIFNLDTRKLKEMGARKDRNLDELEVRNIREYSGVEVSRFATASTRKYLKIYTVDLDNDKHFKIYSDFLKDAMYMTDVFERVVKAEDIHRIVVQEPHYVPGGVPAAVGLNHDIPVYTVGVGKRSNTLMFGRASNRSKLPQFTSRDKVKTVLKEGLSPDEKAAIEDLISSRKKGADVRRQYSPPSSVGVDLQGDFTVGVFTNLTWDAMLEPSGGVYTDVYEWIEETINTLADTDVECIVKVHPAESMLGTNEGMEDWIKNNYSSLPENVSVLPPDTEVNTYRMMQQIDAGVVYCTTVGLEMALDGLPVVVGGFPHYRGFGITSDPDTKEEYRGMLKNIKNIEQSEKSQERAWRYAHLFFIRKEMAFPIEKLDEKILIDDEYLQNDLADIEFSVKKIMKNGPVIK